MSANNNAENRAPQPADAKLDALRKVAEAANQGDRWAYAPHGDTGDDGVGVAFDEITGQTLFGRIDVDEYQVSEPVAVEVKSQAYAAHIATFDPPTALSLIARIRTLERALDKAEVALAPFASLAATPDNEGANMNDPLRKWFTVANLYEAHEALTALRASREPLDHDGEG